MATKFQKAARNWPKSYQVISNDDDKDYNRAGVNSRADVVHIVRGDMYVHLLQYNVCVGVMVPPVLLLARQLARSCVTSFARTRTTNSY